MGHTLLECVKKVQQAKLEGSPRFSNSFIARPHSRLKEVPAMYEAVPIQFVDVTCVGLVVIWEVILDEFRDVFAAVAIGCNLHQGRT